MKCCKGMTGFDMQESSDRVESDGLRHACRPSSARKNTMLRFPKIVIGAGTGAALFMLGIMSAYAEVGPQGVPGSDAARQLELIGKVLDTVRSHYVDKPDDGKLLTAAINGVLGVLDPHSSYMDEKAYRDMRAETSGQFGGLGMQVNMEEGLLKVVSPIDDTPAAKAGILANDVITQVDGTPIKGLTLTEAVEKMRGAPGTEVRLEIMRKDQAAPLNLTLTREIIKVSTVRQEVEGNDVGYVRLGQFNARAADELKQAFQSLTSKIPPDQLKGYILDLRNNPGGLLDQAVRVAGSFLTSGEIVSIRGREPDQVHRFNASPGDLIDGKPLIVLINGGSASASEIVAGALQDQKRATIIGSRTFGKASVQTIIPLGQGNGALRLTTARYYTPSGHSLQAQGIAPDIEVLQDVPKEVAAQAAQTRSESNLPGHLKAEGDEQKGSQSYVPKEAKDDKALQTALALIRGTETNPAFPPSPAQAAVSEH
jgi:carboxyl-terminal processing protease